MLLERAPGAAVDHVEVHQRHGAHAQVRRQLLLLQELGERLRVVGRLAVREVAPGRGGALLDIVAVEEARAEPITREVV